MKISIFFLSFYFIIAYSLNIIASNPSIEFKKITESTTNCLVDLTVAKTTTFNESTTIRGDMIITTDPSIQTFELGGTTNTGSFTCNNILLAHCHKYLILRRTIVKGNIKFTCPEQGQIIMDEFSKIQGIIINGITVNKFN